MARYDPEEGDDDHKKKKTPHTVWRWQPRRRGFQLRRRRRMKTERLGGKKPRRRTVAAALVNMFRKMKMKVKYVCMVKKVKECYRKMVKDMAEAGSGVEIFHQRLYMETSLALPIGITFPGSLYSSCFGPKTLFM